MAFSWLKKIFHWFRKQDGASADLPDRQTAGYFQRLKSRLSKTRKSLSGGFERIFSGKQKIDAEVIEELEELLITSDIGVQTTNTLIERITKAKLSDLSQVKTALKKEILSILDLDNGLPLTLPISRAISAPAA